MTPKKLVQLIEKKAGVKGDKIRDVKVLDTFSFLTVPFKEAEVILDVFRTKNRGKKPMVVRAEKVRQ